MRVISKAALEGLRRRYKPGTRVELLQMDDVQAPPIGTKGTVLGVDDVGSILVAWDNGSGLSVAYGADLCRVVTTMNETIKKQILAIRDTGLTNMFDTNMVQRLAYERDFYELVIFIEEHRKEYVHFILYGEA